MPPQRFGVNGLLILFKMSVYYFSLSRIIEFRGIGVLKLKIKRHYKRGNNFNLNKLIKCNGACGIADDRHTIFKKLLNLIRKYKRSNGLWGLDFKMVLRGNYDCVSN